MVTRKLEPWRKSGYHLSSKHSPRTLSGLAAINTLKLHPTGQGHCEQTNRLQVPLQLWSLVVISITIEHHTESKQHMRSFAGSGTSFGDTLKAPQLISSRKHHTSQIRLGHIAATCRFSLTAHMRMTIEHHTESKQHMWSFAGSGTSFGDTLKAPPVD